jgi:hypothetical protein
MVFDQMSDFELNVSSAVERRFPHVAEGIEPREGGEL